MFVLVGYYVADCSCGPQWADVGCRGNRATIVAGQAVTRGEAVSLSRALKESSTKVILEKVVYMCIHIIKRKSVQSLSHIFRNITKAVLHQFNINLHYLKHVCLLSAPRPNSARLSTLSSAA